MNFNLIHFRTPRGHATFFSLTVERRHGKWELPTTISPLGNLKGLTIPDNPTNFKSLSIWTYTPWLFDYPVNLQSKRFIVLACIPKVQVLMYRYLSRKIFPLSIIQKPVNNHFQFLWPINKTFIVMLMVTINILFKWQVCRIEVNGAWYLSKTFLCLLWNITQ